VGVDENLHGLGEIVIFLAHAFLLDGALEFVNSDEAILKAIKSAQNPRQKSNLQLGAGGFLSQVRSNLVSSYILFVTICCERVQLRDKLEDSMFALFSF
jgi:hypothetical protein